MEKKIHNAELLEFKVIFIYNN